MALNFCFCVNWDASGVGISLRLNIECLFSYKKKMTSTLNLSVLVLATMVAVLAGMVGYMYWQQNKVIQAVTQLSGFVASQFIKQPDLEVEEESDDDRESVEETTTAKEETSPKEDKPTEIVTDIDDLQGKTAIQLKELLSKKGLPYGKRDSKSVLLQLLKASS
jgi:flagellar basal body-associated protein FliL